MLNKFLSRPNNFPCKRFLWRRWYNHLASRYADIKIIFMNYGYANLTPDAEHLELDGYEEERYCIQLYHHVANAISLKGLDVLEVGCGRGGGAFFIKRYLNPKSVTGVDFSESNINFCQSNSYDSQMKFCVGDAELLLFDNCSFDVVINVESSHCYNQVKNFFDETFRVLRPNGYFLIADFRPKEDIDSTREMLTSSGFKIVKEEIITANVFKAMDLENDRKVATVKEKIPKYLQPILHLFFGSEGTPIYEAFKNRELEYLCYILQKQAVYTSS